MRSLQELLPRLLPLVPGCPDPTALQALVDSAMAFCEETAVIQEVLDPAPLQAGQAQYDIDMPPGSECSRVLSAWVNGQPLQVVGHIGLRGAALYEGSTTGTPRWAVSVEPGVINLAPTPSEREAGQALRLLVALKPTLSAKVVDDRLLAHWAEPIVMGAVSRLAVVPGTTFTNLDLAQMGRAAYLRGASMAKRERHYGRAMSSARMRGPSFSGR